MRSDLLWGFLAFYNTECNLGNLLSDAYVNYLMKYVEGARSLLPTRRGRALSLTISRVASISYPLSLRLRPSPQDG